jgi:hypothetical protein
MLNELLNIEQFYQAKFKKIKTEYFGEIEPLVLLEPRKPLTSEIYWR